MRALPPRRKNAEIGNGTLIINGERHTVDIRHFDCEKNIRTATSIICL
ncbi:MAG: hypothetical protein L6V93_13735 [Clostridiales bacterium]|nr:MAG: hypothetical protein L6V93_13735 [Clostridiales bacterium]